MSMAARQPEGDSTEAQTVKQTYPKTRSQSSRGKDGANGQPRFSHANAFESLRDLKDDLLPISAETPASTSNAVPPASSLTKKSPKPSHSKSGKDLRSRKGLLPSWDTHFWRVHGNKLRVFGTLEEMCDLTKGPDSAEESKDESAELNSPRRSSLSLWDVLDKVKQRLG